MIWPRKNMNRREFVATALAGIGSVGLLGTSGTRAKANNGQAAGVPLISRALGKTGIRLPVVNMGVMNADNPDLVRRAYELGIRHFDSAATYARGRNEEMVGKVIRDLGVRDRVIVATKVAIPPQQRRTLEPEELKRRFLESLDASLSRLNMDHVDILYIHDCLVVDDVRSKGFQEALVQAKKDGKARFVGFSTHGGMTDLVNDAAGLGLFDVILVAFNYALAGDKALFQALELAAAKGIGLIAMKTQCMQDWYREFVPVEGQPFYREGIVQTAVLKWVLQHKFISCAVPGFTTFQQLDEDITVARDLGLTPEEKKFLEDRSVLMAMRTCVQCRDCVKTCPRGADVPVLMRTYLYTLYPNFIQARDVLGGIPGGRGLDACASCTTCGARCRGRVDIGRRVKELKALFLG